MDVPVIERHLCGAGNFDNCALHNPHRVGLCHSCCLMLPNPSHCSSRRCCC
jgi:hypothetical protein